MSSQRFRFQRWAYFMAALAVASLLFPAAATAGDALLLIDVTAVDPDPSLPAFQAAGSAVDTPYDKDVDPWDDDLDGKKPPPPPPHGTSVSGEKLSGSAISLAGVLHHGAGDDEELFSFRLSVHSVLDIVAVSDSPLQLVLRDSDGRPIAVTQSEAAGMPLRLARSLAAGLYFLAVEGLNGDDALYALTLHRPARP